MDEPLFVKFLSPPNFRELLCKGSSKTLITDARNHYESQVGHFHGAFLPPIQRFLSLPIYIEKFIRQYKRMFSSRRRGIHAYIERQNIHKPKIKLWQGKNYVFDAKGSIGAACRSMCISCGVAAAEMTKCSTSYCHLNPVACMTCQENPL